MKSNEAILKVIQEGNATISDDTLEKAADWIEQHSFQVLRKLMQGEDWKFCYKPEYAALNGLDLRDEAINQLYGDAKLAASTIDSVMEITIEIQS